MTSVSPTTASPASRRAANQVAELEAEHLFRARHDHGGLGRILARWGTASRVEIAQSPTLRNLATRDDLTALSRRNFDASTFNGWFIAFTLNSPQKEAISERGFRPVFRIAFNPWMAGGRPCGATSSTPAGTDPARDDLTRGVVVRAAQLAVDRCVLLANQLCGSTAAGTIAWTAAVTFSLLGISPARLGGRVSAERVLVIGSALGSG